MPTAKPSQLDLRSADEAEQLDATFTGPLQVQRGPGDFMQAGRLFLSWLGAAIACLTATACSDSGLPTAAAAAVVFHCPCTAGYVCEPSAQVCLDEASLPALNLTLTTTSPCDGKAVSQPTRLEFAVRSAATGGLWRRSEAVASASANASAKVSLRLPSGRYDITATGFAGGWATPTWHGRVKGIELVKDKGAAISFALYPVGELACPLGDQALAPLMFPTAAGLPDGRVALAGGLTHAGQAAAGIRYDAPTTAAFVFDARQSSLAAAGSLITGRAGHSMAWLPNPGKLLVVGGVAAMEQPADGASPPSWDSTSTPGYELLDIDAKSSTAGDLGGLTLAPRAFGQLLPLPGGAFAAIAGSPWPPFARLREGEGDVFLGNGSWQRAAGGCGSVASTVLLGDELGGAAVARYGSPASAQALIWGGDVTVGQAHDSTSPLPWRETLARHWKPSRRAPIAVSQHLILESQKKPPESALLLSAIAAAPRPEHGATPRFLAVGGARVVPPSEGQALAWQAPDETAAWTVELTEPSLAKTGRAALSPVQGLAGGLVFHQATAAAENAVVVSGGMSQFLGAASGKLRVFDNASGALVAADATAPGFSARVGHVAVALENDCVLFYGGVAGLGKDAFAGGAPTRLEVFCPTQLASTAPLVAPALFEADQAPPAKQVAPLKLDMLFVVDHSSSMCQEQRWIARGVAGFVATVAQQAKVLLATTADIQAAVVTAQQVPDGKTIKKIGKFVHDPATNLPPSCIEKSKQPCMADGDCAKPKCFTFATFDANSSMCPQGGDSCLTPAALAASDWYCKSSPPEPPNTTNKMNNNDNCSVNTSCQLRCKTDDDCYAMFEPNIPPGGKHKVRCNTVVSPAGCMFGPETDGCPASEKLPGVLKQSEAVEIDIGDGKTKAGTQLDLFRCNATVGANQEPEALFEGGLRSAWQALDPIGPNCPRDNNGAPTGSCQYDELVRAEAFLVVVLVSDDDDCSLNFELDPYLGDMTTEEQKGLLLKLLPKELQRSCQVHNDRVAGNRDLLVGYCEAAKFKDPVDKKRKCPADCDAIADKNGQAYKGCSAEAEASLAALLKDNPQGQLRSWRFAAVSDFVNRLRSLKEDPSRVVFATVTGDALKPANAGAQWSKRNDRISYYRSLLRNNYGVQAPYVCSSALGEAGFGSRYIRLAEAFGCQGIVRNICDGDPDKAESQWAEFASAVVKATQ